MTVFTRKHELNALFSLCPLHALRFSNVNLVEVAYAIVGFFIYNEYLAEIPIRLILLASVTLRTESCHLNSVLLVFFFQFFLLSVMCNAPLLLLTFN